MKIVPPDNLAVLCEQLHAAGAVIVFAYGVFDLLHPGHIHFLREARKLGTHLLVALHTDDSAREIKGDERPLISLEERVEVLAAMEMINYVTWFDQETPEMIVREVKPDVLLNANGEAVRFIESGGGRAVSIPFLNGHSTSNIVERITKLPRI